MSPKKLLSVAAKFSRLKQDDRCYCLGAVAIRGDDVLVWACNSAPKQPTPLHHAEAKLARKLDRGAIVYLARTLADGTWANSKPCNNCHRILKNAYVTRVYFTTGPDTFDCLTFE